MTPQTRWGRLGRVLACLALLGAAAFASTSAFAQGKGKKAPTPATRSNIVDIPATNQGVEQINRIDESIEEKWKENKVTPSNRCSDYEFIRRASLDIIGRIAKVHEIETFMKEPERNRRSNLIERLLGNDPRFPDLAEEYTQNWANIWTVMLLTRGGSKEDYQKQLREWLAEKMADRRDAKTKSYTYEADWSKIFQELITATGKTNENGAVNYILHHLGEEVKNDSSSGKFDMVPITSRTTRLFLGLRTQCVQCHDHPFNGDWGQHHFWGVNAYFRQTSTGGSRPTLMVKKKKDDKFSPQYELRDDGGLNREALVSYERRNALILYTDPTFLDGKKMNKKSVESGQTTRRQELAKQMVGSPYFSKVFVNRMWAHFFGKSFTKDNPDDFGDHNPASHPELLDTLAEDWATKYQHNPKDVIRWICNSRAYGLSSIANSTNDKPEDEVLFARMMLKSLSPEQLFESLMVATQAKVAQSKEAKSDLRREWLSKLIDNFGDDEGNETSYNGTVVQALMLMNGQDINTAIMDPNDGTVANIIKKHGRKADVLQAVMTDIYMAGLNRKPTDKEMKNVLSPKMINYQLHPELQKKNPADFWTGVYQDLMWAVLNSNEFILNH